MRIATTLAAVLIASVAAGQAPAAGSAQDTGAPQLIAPQTQTSTPPVAAGQTTVAPTPADVKPEIAAPAPGAAVTPPAVIGSAGATAMSPEAAEPVAIAPNASAPSDVAAINDDLPHDLSPVGMFMAADWIVKGVMLALCFASLVTWTVWLAKTLQLLGARARAKRGLTAIIQAKSLKDVLAVLEQRGGVVASMVRAAQHEMNLSDGAIDRAGAEGVKERVASALGRIEVRAGRQMSKGTGVLASIGSTAPFVGLFGTVWGIMNSFIGIAETQTTNLAVVAPGIAEALLATAVGLVAAIPAVIIYNVFARSVTGYRQLVSDAAAGIERLVSRDLDFRKSALSVRMGNLQAAE
ncbi:MAG: tonB-system energizer ExbB [Rhizobium sp.]|nr:tonB-system energizer ExbB [Rhizobium sp.]